MKILSEEEMADRLDFRRPLNPTPEPTESRWCIPFEFGGAAKGTRITVAKAKEIAAELRASIAEAEARELRREFDNERARNAELCKQYSTASDERFAALSEVAALKQNLRARGSSRAKGPAR